MRQYPVRQVGIAISSSGVTLLYAFYVWQTSHRAHINHLISLYQAVLQLFAQSEKQQRFHEVLWGSSQRALLCFFIVVVQYSSVFMCRRFPFYRVRQHNFLFSKLNKTHCMNQNIFIFL